MDFRATDEEPNRRVPLAPLVDILFILLVFLLSLYALSKVERDMSIALPEAESAGTARRGLHDLLVNVRADGRLVMNGRQVTMEEFGATLERVAREFPTDAVVVRADGATPHRTFVQVLDVCRKHGIKNVAVVTAPASSPPVKTTLEPGTAGLREREREEGGR